MARPASLLSLPGDDEAEEGCLRRLPRSSPTPRPRPPEEEALEAGRGRRVRFADALGLPLVEVQRYDSLCGCPLLEVECHSRLCYAQAQCSDRGCAQVQCNARDCSQAQCNDWGCGLLLLESRCQGRVMGLPLCSALSPDPAQELGALQSPPHRRSSPFYLCPTFPLPAMPLQTLDQRVQASGVELESLLPCPEDPRAMRGVMRVLNLSYCKSVWVRATFDRWATFYDHPADYLASCPGGLTDQFAFRLVFTPPYAYDGARLEFVVRYETPGQTFWANNAGKNYGVVLKAVGSSPAPQPPVKQLFWELEQRRLKSCLKPMKHRPAEDFSEAERTEDIFPTVGLTSLQEDLSQLVKPTPLHPERLANQVPSLMVTSTSPEKLYSCRPMTFTESEQERAAEKGGNLSTPPEEIMVMQKPCEEGEAGHRPRRDKSTWIGDLNTLRCTGMGFMNGEEDTIDIVEDLTCDKSILERPTDSPPVVRCREHSYVLLTSEDSDNEDAVEEELEQLYLSHLSRLQAAKEPKEPSEVEVAQGISKEPHIGTQWNAPVSPLDLAGTKRILNTWLVEEISLRHANGRDQGFIGVASEDGEQPTSSCESSPCHMEREPVENEPSSSVVVTESPDKASEREGVKTMVNRKVTEVTITTTVLTGGVFSDEENAEVSAVGHLPKEPSYSLVTLPEAEATDAGLICLPHGSRSVVTYQPSVTGAVIDNTREDEVKILPETGENWNLPVLEPQREILAHGYAVGALAGNTDHSWEVKQEQESVLLSKDPCELETPQNLQENVLRKEVSKTMQESLLLSKEPCKPEPLRNLQERVPLSREPCELESPQNLQENNLLSKEPCELETLQNLQEPLLLSKEPCELETLQNLQEPVALSEEPCELETPQHLQESVLLSKEPCDLETPQNLQAPVALSKEPCELETPQKLQEKVSLSKEPCELEIPQNLQDNALRKEVSKTMQESLLLRKELCELVTPPNRPLMGEGDLYALLTEGLVPSSSSALLDEGLQDQDSAPLLNAALSQSCRFLCVLVFLPVMLESCMSSVAVLLYLISVWFL